MLTLCHASFTAHNFLITTLTLAKANTTRRPQPNMTMSICSSRLLPARFRSDERRKSKASRLTLSYLNNLNTNGGTHRSSSFRSLFSSAIVDKYLRKDSTPPLKQTTSHSVSRKLYTTAICFSPRRTTDSEPSAALHKSKGVGNLQELCDSSSQVITGSVQPMSPIHGNLLHDSCRQIQSIILH